MTETNQEATKNNRTKKSARFSELVGRKDEPEYLM